VSAKGGRKGGRSRGLRRLATPALPMLWLGLFFLTPFAIILRMSFSSAATAQPPYRPVFDLAAGWTRFVADLKALTFDNYALIAQDDLYMASLASALRLALLSTLILVLIGYPIALAMARAPARWKPVLIALVILPFWTSFLIRAYAWIGILRPGGHLDLVLQTIGLTAAPLGLLNTDWAVVIGLVYGYLPFMVLPLFAAVDRLDVSLVEAAQDLGCPPGQVFWRVVLPLTLPGAAAGALLVFIPSVGEIVIPDLLGGSDTLMIGRTLWSEFFANRDWPLASALAVLLLAALLPPILAWRALEARRWEPRK
jgi:putrescine transport system permease protein